MSLVCEYKGFYRPLPSVPQELLDEWKDTLKAERDRILSSLKEKIKNVNDFLVKIAEPSIEAWQDFVNPEWVDKDIIMLKRAVKLKGAYQAWLSGVEKAFAQGGTFEQNVDIKKDKFDKARYTMGAVGIRYKTAWGCAYKAIGVISADRRVVRYMGADDTFTGVVVNAFKAGTAKYARPVAIAAITRGLVLAQYAHEANLPNERTIIINLTNNALSNTVLSFVDTTKYNVTLKIDFDPVANRLYSYSRVTTV